MNSNDSHKRPYDEGMMIPMSKRLASSSHSRSSAIFENQDISSDLFRPVFPDRFPGLSLNGSDKKSSTDLALGTLDEVDQIMNIITEMETKDVRKRNFDFPSNFSAVTNPIPPTSSSIVSRDIFETIRPSFIDDGRWNQTQLPFIHPDSTTRSMTPRHHYSLSNTSTTTTTTTPMTSLEEDGSYSSPIPTSQDHDSATSVPVRFTATPQTSTFETTFLKVGNRFQCQICHPPNLLSTQKEAIKHYRNRHTPYTCSKCNNESFTGYFRLNAHNKKFHSKPFTQFCTCGRGFSSEKGLHKHQVGCQSYRYHQSELRKHQVPVYFFSST